MAFDRGIVGVAIVLLSLFGATALGVLLNIENETVTKDTEEYVADITGGLTTQKEQSYISYNTSANYNGYSNPDVENNYPVDFEKVSYTNNYPFTYNAGTVTSSYNKIESIPGTSGVVNDSTRPGYILARGYFYNTLSSPIANPEHPSYPYTKLLTDCTGPYGYVVVDPTELNGFREYGSPYRTVMDIVNACINEADGEEIKYIKISITATVKKYTIYPSTPTGGPQDSWEVYYLDNGAKIYPMSYSTESNNYRQGLLRDMGEGATFTTLIEYNVSTREERCYINNSLISERILNPNASGPNKTGWNITIPSAYGNYYQYIEVTDTYYSDVIDNISYGQDVAKTTVQLPDSNHTDINIQYSTERHRDYLDTRFGVGIRDSETVVWQNNQKNGVIDLATSVWNASSKTFTENGSNYQNTGTIHYFNKTATDTFTIFRSAGQTYVSLNEGSSINIGTWAQVQLNIDSVRGRLTVSPIQTWDNFNNYLLFGTEVQIGNLQKGDIESITWTGNNSFRIGVTDTTVFFNTYGVTMIDPSITITSLWPNYPRFVVDLTKVATIGESITIGSDTYPITNGSITINNRSIKVPDMKIYYTKSGNEWNITVSSGKDSATITEPSTFLQFNGLWYFSMGFYEIVSKQVTERVWNPNYNFIDGNLFFWMAGIAALMGIIAFKMHLLDPYSIGILIIAELILFAIGGVS